jgi:copper type II ascorbate-dependent monooxygenase-like protein
MRTLLDARPLCHPVELPREVFAMRFVVPLLLPILLVAVPVAAKQRPIKLTAHVGRVKTGTEKQTCFPITFPRDQAVDVEQVQIFVHGGSHHVHLYRPTAGTVMYPNPDNTYSPAGPHNRRPRECAFAVDFSHWELVAASQTADLNWRLPPGVGIRFEPHQPLMIQTHFVNTGFGSASLAVKGRARAKMLLYPMEASTVTAHGGALFAQDRAVNVPPGSTTASSICHLTGDASENREMTVMALTGHYHFRGKQFVVWRTLPDGTRVEPPVYVYQNYSDPPFVQYPPGSLVLKPGEGLEWECTWQNDSDQTFKFGPNTEKNEHCNLFGFYYPTENALEAIDCVHKEDGSDVRIVAE